MALALDEIRKNLAGIEAVLRHGLSKALVESTNTKLRLLTRMAFGFASPTPSSPLPSWTEAATAPRYLAGRAEGTHGWLRRATIALDVSL